MSDYSEGRLLHEELADDQPFEEILILHIIQKMLTALAYLHDKKILHGSVTPMNIAFKNSNNDFFQLNLYNFELAVDFRSLNNNNNNTKPPFELPYHTYSYFNTTVSPYMAPEIIEYTGQHSVDDYLKSDIYSLGMILYQLNYLELPTS